MASSSPRRGGRTLAVVIATLLASPGLGYLAQPTSAQDASAPAPADLSGAATVTGSPAAQPTDPGTAEPTPGGALDARSERPVEPTSHPANEPSDVGDGPSEDEPTSPPAIEPTEQVSGDDAADEAAEHAGDASASDDQSATARDPGTEDGAEPGEDAVVSSGQQADEPAVFEALVADVQVQKTNSLDGQPAEPGDSYTYQFVVTCSSIDEDCVGLTFTDTFPPEVVVDESSLPGSIPDVREVTWDDATQTLTIEYVQLLDNPPGTGLPAGSQVTFDVTVTVPEDTDLDNGDVISNTAEVDGDNSQPDDDTSDVDVVIPRVVDPVTTKGWSSSTAIAGSDVESSFTLGVTNMSSTSAEVTELAVSDLDVDTWEHLDFTGASVATYPSGADTAQLYVCTADGSACPPEDLVPGGTGTAPGPSDLGLPDGVAAEDVTGVEVVFRNADGSVIPRDPQGGGEVVIGTQLRDTYRSTGEELQPTDTIDIDNCASISATDPVLGEVDGDDACAAYQILPSTLVLEPTKSFFPDTDGDFDEENGEYAVIGEDSPVSGTVDVHNASPFPIGEVVIREPNEAPPPDNEFDKLDVDSIRLRFPDGATNAEVVVTYESDPTSTTDYGPDDDGTTIELHPPDSRVTSITVTYTGVDADGNPTIAPDSTAGLDVHGTLTDDVTEEDLPNGTSPGVDNCVDVTGDAARGDGTGTFAGAACASLVPELPDDSMNGNKANSQDEVIPGSGVLFRMTTTNNGNRALSDVVVSDPPLTSPEGGPDAAPDPAFDNLFDNATFANADIQPASMASQVDIEVREAGTWIPMADATDLAAIDAVRAATDTLAPTQSFTLRLAVFFDDPLPDGFTLGNCYETGATSDILEPVEPWCSPEITIGDANESANLNKFIDPPELPRLVPGLPRQEATVTLRLANVGNTLMAELQAIDNDPDFFDAVDFVRFGEMVAPAVNTQRADLLQVDACTVAPPGTCGDGDWVNGSPGPVGSPTLPDDLTPIEVRGLRFTFSSSLPNNDGYLITPCDDDDCAAFMDFVVSPRENLLSDPGQPIPDTLEDTATGAYDGQLDPDGNIGLVDADIDIVPGDHQIDVDKLPDIQSLDPGEPGLLDLAVTNNGTALINDLTIVDPIPDQLTFDETYDPDGDGDPATGGPYDVVVTDLPDGYPEPPPPVFEITADPDDSTRVGEVRWAFEGWEMPVGATVTATIRVTLAPGVTAGEDITNTTGASSSDTDLACSSNDGVAVDDPAYGDGTYCTDPAVVTSNSGASFQARKWVAGTPELGWFSPRAGNTVVPVGGGDCPVYQTLGRTYTANPCQAIVDPGDPFHYVLRIQNAGTEPAEQMVVVDGFPAPGDSGVLAGDRLTEWENRPTLATPVRYFGPDTGTVSYTEDIPVCNLDLTLDDGDDCPAGNWSAPQGPAATGFRVEAAFDPDKLGPGELVRIAFSMDTPVDVPANPGEGPPTTAWNSFAHAEQTVTAQGNDRVLPPVEPIRVGAGTLYGNLEVIKQVGDNPAGLDLDDVEFTFEYACTLRNGTPWPVDGEPGTMTATPTTPGLVTGIPDGATCTVTETGTQGGIPSDPVTVEISTDDTTPITSTATFTNDFPLAEFDVLKDVTGFTDPFFTGGPYPVDMECTFAGDEVPGFPITVDLVPTVVSDPIEAPVGSTCTVTETDDQGATTVTYDPANADGTAAEFTIEAGANEPVHVTIANDFPFGAISLLKEVTGGVDPAFTDPALTGAPYVVGLDCQFDGVSLPGYPVVVELVPDDEQVFEPIPVGAVCTATETDDRGATTVTYDPPDDDGSAAEVTVTDGSDQAPIAITVSNDFPAGGLEVRKAIGQNDADLDLDDLPYTFAYQCTFDPGSGDPVVVPPEPGELVATVNEPAVVEGLPAGATCEVWETDTNGGIPSATEDDPAVVTIEAATILQPTTRVTVTNDYPTGRAELVKLVEGDALEVFTGGPYPIVVSCWGPDQEPGSGEPFPGFPVIAEVVPDQPVGAEVPVGTTCWFQEQDVAAGIAVTYQPANADGTAGVVVVPPVEPPDDGVIGTVSVTNTYETGSLVIEKVTSGPGAPAFSQGPFTFDVGCGYLGVEDVHSVTVVVEGSADGSPVESEPITGLPIGTTCTVTEVDDGGADETPPPVTVTIEGGEEAEVAIARFDNPFSAGSVAVVKNVDGDGADSDYVAGLTFTIAVECALEENGELVTVLSQDVTVAGDGVAVPVAGDDGRPLLVPLGARCWGTEVESFGASAVAIDHDSWETAVEVVADADGGMQVLAIDIANTYDPAFLTVAKEAVNAPDPGATWTFAVACTIPDADGTMLEVPLLDGASPVQLAAGEAATFEVLRGATCAVTETAADGATVTFAETGGDDDPGDGVVTVVDTATVTVTNTFPALGPTPDSPDGDLPRTGAGRLVDLVLAALTLAGAGVGLVVVARRRRRGA